MGFAPVGKSRRNSQGVGRRIPGRPRRPETRQRILEATLRMLADQGFTRMSMESVADAAGVGKPTIYRRWASKADLATAALEQLRVSEPGVCEGNAVERLKAALANFGHSLLRPGGMRLIGTVLAEEVHTPELLNLFRERVVRPRRALISAALVQARDEGVLPGGSDIEAAVNMLIGSFYARYLSGDPVTPEWVDRIVGLLIPAAER